MIAILRIVLVLLEMAHGFGISDERLVAFHRGEPCRRPHRVELSVAAGKIVPQPR